MPPPSILNFKITPPNRPAPEEDFEAPPEDNIVYEEIDSLTPEPRSPRRPSPRPELIDELEEMIDINLVKKPAIDEQEIFSDAPVRKRGQPTRSTTPKKVKRQARKPLSEEAKENRRLALERGRATRASNLAKKKQLEAEARDLENTQLEMQNEEKALDLQVQNQKLNKKAKKVKKVIIDDSSSEEEIQYVKKSKVRHRSPPPSRSSITAEDIERAQINTLVAYEKLRKDRKAEKQRVKAIEKEQEQIRETMKQVNHSQPAWGRHRGAGKYGNLLNQMGL